MRLKGKKPIFNYKDTWSMDKTLSPIIAEGLKKYKEVVETSEFGGVPGTLVCEMFPDTPFNHTDEQIEMASERWYEVLDLMIYAFEDKEPNLEDYNFEFHQVWASRREQESEGVEEGREKAIEENPTFTIENDNEVEYNRYREDEKAHNLKVDEGLQLFGKFYKNLWW